MSKAIIAAVLTAVAIYLPTVPLLQHTGGIALYPLDDTYIHLALGRTLAETGVWGVAPDVPAAASSSPLWTVVLAAGRFFVASDRIYSWLPLALNVIAAIALLLLSAKILAGSGTPALLAVTLGSALPALALLGLEHVLQCLTTLALAWSAAGSMTTDAKNQPLTIGVLSALAVATRYESLFLVLVIALGFLITNRRREAAAAIAGALLPAFGFGLFWIAHGGRLLPNALMLKGPGGMSGDSTLTATAMLMNLARNVAGRSVGAPKGLIEGTILLLMAVLWVLARSNRAAARDRIFAHVVLATMAVHTVLGQFGWLYRYEAWLVVLAAVASLRLATVIVVTPRARLAVAGALLLALAPRAWAASIETSRAPADRLWEHFGPAKVFQGALAGRPVLANDIGVLAYIRRGRPVDLFGLADNLPVAKRREGAYGPDGVSDFARLRDAHVGVVQICWTEVSHRFPSDWILVEVWQGPRNVVFADRTVAFIAREEGADALTEALQRTDAPRDVERWLRDDPRVARFNEAKDKRAATYAGVCQY